MCRSRMACARMRSSLCATCRRALGIFLATLCTFPSRRVTGRHGRRKIIALLQMTQNAKIGLGRRSSVCVRQITSKPFVVSVYGPR